MYPDSEDSMTAVDQGEGESVLDENPKSEPKGEREGEGASDREHFGAEEPQRNPDFPEDAGYGMDDHRSPEESRGQYPEDHRSPEEPHNAILSVMDTTTPRKGWKNMNINKV